MVLRGLKMGCDLPLTTFWGGEKLESPGHILNECTRYHSIRNRLRCGEGSYKCVEFVIFKILILKEVQSILYEPSHVHKPSHRVDISIDVLSMHGVESEELLETDCWLYILFNHFLPPISILFFLNNCSIFTRFI